MILCNLTKSEMECVVAYLDWISKYHGIDEVKPLIMKLELSLDMIERTSNQRRMSNEMG